MHCQQLWLYDSMQWTTFCKLRTNRQPPPPTHRANRHPTPPAYCTPATTTAEQLGYHTHFVGPTEALMS